MTRARRWALIALAAACLFVGTARPTPAAPPARAPKAAPAPARTAKAPARTKTRSGKATAPRDPQKSGAFARVAFGRAGELRPTREAQAGARRTEALTAEEETAAQIQKLLRGPLRSGVTGLFVADAKSGEPLFAVNAGDPLNPASNVKLISTAAALELLGPEFRYPTRVLGPTPVGGVVRGDVYLLGSWDPTLAPEDLRALAGALAARGITSVQGDIVVGGDPTRDGLYRAILPIEITAGEPGKPPTAVAPAGMDLVEVRVTATTGKTRRSRLTYKDELVRTPAGLPRIVLTVGGTIGAGVTVTYPLWTRQRTAAAAYTLRAALEAQGVAVGGELKVMELGDFVGATVGLGALPVELARHDSPTAADIAATVNKWSINWLSDRLIMTAAGLAARKPPSMDLAIEAMYSWLSRHPRLPKGSIIIDTGSGLSYKTQISPQELVSVVRSAAGFLPDDTTEPVASAWLRSLSVAGMDGTLGHRFRGTGAHGHIFGKTGTLSTAIALSGVLDVDPQRPLAFALVTNTDAPLSKPYVRRAHELVLAEICKYLSKTAARSLVTPGAPGALVPEVAPAVVAKPAPAVTTVPVTTTPSSDEAVSEDYDAELDRETLEPK